MLLRPLLRPAVVLRHFSTASVGLPDYVPVAIVGAGPTGLVLSSLLSSLGARSRRNLASPSRPQPQPGRLSPPGPNPGMHHQQALI
jgi:hypothetical protein